MNAGKLQSADISLVVVFDNYPKKEGLRTAWGFSCLIRGGDETVLFDTGGDGEVLLHNMRRLGIDPRSIDRVFLSHAHADHTGGLGALLGANPGMAVNLLASFPSAFKREIERAGASVSEVSGPLDIGRGLLSTGELGTGPLEQSLVLRTDLGAVLITGCAHPGIVSIVEKAVELLDGDPVRLVLGGFHLRDHEEPSLRRIAARLQELGVRRFGPSHCSGDLTRAVWSSILGGDYLELGAGAELASLKELLL